MKEIWKDIEGYEGLYQISNTGRVKSFARTTISKDNRTMKFPEKVLSDRGLDKNGYVLNILTDSNKNKSTKKAHRLVAQAFLPNPNNLPQVNHKNGIKNDNRVENLEWVSCSENQRHAVDVLKVVSTKGEDIGTSILTEDLVRELRRVREETGYSYTKLQEIYGINRATIHLAVTGRTWGHIE